ncbi:MAG: hypothetical protein WAQ08_20900 [Aquabacterium sp.]|uniref:hypothetical protein n=1 Tax=Aquabacterium sp. TaxID=1872578 RepID=UPI003BB1C4E4
MSNADRDNENDESAKRLCTLKAFAALAGFQIVRSHPEDGPVKVIATRWSIGFEFDDLSLAEQFIAAQGQEGVPA